MPVEKKIGQRIQKFKSVDDMRQFYAELNSMQGDGEEIGLDFNIDYYSDDVCTKIVEVAEKTSKMGFKPHVRVRGNNLEFTKAEIESLNACEDGLQKEGVELFISDDFNLYSLDETMVAYAKLRAVADEIKSHVGSPFEKFLEIYGYVTSYIYKKNEDNVGMSRDIISIMTGDDIVCVGYAKLMEYLCKEIGVDCRCVCCDLFTTENEYTSSHECNLVYLKDEKYGIDGWYHVDACWDSVKHGGKPYLNYNYCLIPIEDIKHSTTKHFDFYYETEAIYGDENELFIDYFNKPAKIRKCMEFLGIEFDKKISTVSDKEYNAKRNRALNILFELFKQYKIPADVYQVVKSATGIFEVESLLAMCFDYQKNENRINYLLKELKNRYDELKIKKSSSKNEIENVYEFLMDLKEETASAEERQKVRHAEVIIKNENVLFEKVSQMRQSSKSISMKKFAHALKFNEMQKGQTELQAETFSKRALIHTTKRAELRFDSGATNAFKKKSMQIANSKASN